MTKAALDAVRGKKRQSKLLKLRPSERASKE